MSPGIPVGGVWGPDSVWRTDVTRAPVQRDSKAKVDNLVTQLKSRFGGHAAFNIYQFGVAWYNVPAGQPKVRVAFDNCQGKPRTPPGLFGENGQFEAVPIPDDVTSTIGSDSAITIYQPSSDTMWNFWKARRSDGRWQACWGGRIDDVSKSPGYFDGYFGTSASGLANEAGAVSLNDVRSGSIDHAVALALPVESLSEGFTWPARRSDGGTAGSVGLAEGTRLRLPETIDVEGLGLSRIATLVAAAAQRYGFIVTDRAGTVSIPAESSTAGRSTSDGDPWSEFLQGRKSYNVLDGFPWDRLEVVAAGYGRRG